MLFNPFVCLSGSLDHGDQEDHRGGPWSPRRPKCCRNSTTTKKMNKNPFSTRGLDKFAMVLADLDLRRQKIYEQMGLQDAYSLVGFGYSSSKGNWVPIVVKLKSQQQAQAADRKGINKINKPVVVDDDDDHHHQVFQNDVEQHNVKEEEVEARAKKKGLIMMPIRFIMNRPYYDLAFVMILILLCLVIYGRSFAIICTSISWYWVPTIKENQEFNYLRRRSIKKKDFIKKLSDNRMMMRSTVTSRKGKNLRFGLSSRQNVNSSSNW